MNSVLKEWPRMLNPLALVDTAQTLQGTPIIKHQSLKNHCSNLKQPHFHPDLIAITMTKGKEIAKPITLHLCQASEKDSVRKQARWIKNMQKNLALIAMYFKKLLQLFQQQTLVLLHLQETINVDTTAKQSDWLEDTDEEIDEQELEAHYSYMVQYDTKNDVFANEIQHFEQSESISNTCVVKTDDSNVIPNSSDMCDNDIRNDQNDVECDDERVALANLISNLKLDVDENKKIQKQLKKANATLTQELTECKSVLTETSRTLEESNSIRDSCLVTLQNKQTKLEEYMALFNNRFNVDYGET
ncbi:hypothetical protein Tco_1121137 [Tanacetum coccineum]|uniref:Uncharacterized protein n=1 Tax=Tanacetum coccineum TaxID=301880 RepID=A0ABQ5IWU3_9ASTR